LLQGEKPHIFEKDNPFPANAKDPKLREKFLQRFGDQNGIGVLEEKDLNVSSSLPELINGMPKVLFYCR